MLVYYDEIKMEGLVRRLELRGHQHRRELLTGNLYVIFIKKLNCQKKILIKNSILVTSITSPFLPSSSDN